MKILFILLSLFISILITGCACTHVLNNEVDVSVIENVQTMTYSGVGVHHNISIMIQNMGASTATSLKIKTYYCSKNAGIPCVNNSFNIGDLPSNSTITKYFEYDRDAITAGFENVNPLSLRYIAESCLSQ